MGIEAAERLPPGSVVAIPPEGSTVILTVGDDFFEAGGRQLTVGTAGSMTLFTREDLEAVHVLGRDLATCEEQREACWKKAVLGADKRKGERRLVIAGFAASLLGAFALGLAVSANAGGR